MSVLAKKIPPVQKMQGGQATEKPLAQSFTFPAPIKGWVLNENLAGVSQGSARVLDNWICTTTGIRPRGGASKYATLPAACTSLMTYRAATSKFFAATASGIYDITTPASPTTVPSAAVSGRANGFYSSAMFGTAGGTFMYAVNGVDSPLLFDGATWTAITGASTPAITGVTTSNLINVWSFANRLFFVEKNSMTAWYLPVDSIGGAANSFSLAGVFTRGGTLLFGGKWSMDAGDGLDDKCVFVSSEGEVAIYQGTNPGSAADWSLAGVYFMPKPMGRNAYIQAGGDLLVATENGLIPVSASVNTDIGAIETKAVSQPIAPYWQNRGKSLIQLGWEIIKAPGSGIMVVSQPDTSGVTKTCLATNLITGAWSRFTGWDARCLGSYLGNGYFGAADSCVYLMDAGGSDGGAIYTAAYLGQFEHMGVYGQTKTIRQMRAMFQTGTPINPQLLAKADYNETLASPPSSPANYTTDAWDSGLWDTAIWDATTSAHNEATWVSIGVTGKMIAPELQLTFGVTPTPSVELVAIDAQFHVGAAVT